MKKILILSSCGGYGHIAATQSIQALIGNDYQLSRLFPFRKLRFLGIPLVIGESMYNFFLSKNWNWAANLLARVGSPIVCRGFKKKLIKMIRDRAQEASVDMIISTIPFINYHASVVAKDFDLPLLLVTTDFDLHNWSILMERLEKVHFKITIGALLPTTKGTLLKKGISPEAIELTGLPLRPDFLKQWDKHSLHQKYEIPSRKKVILLVMGGAGGNGTYSYAKALAQVPMDLHLIVCTGRNGLLAEKVRSLKPAQSNTLEVVPFTEKMGELFALADLVITKPGPGTISESFASQLPILVDQIYPVLFWEKATITLVCRYGVGEAISSLQSLPQIAKRYLTDETTKRAIAKSYQKIPNNSFADRLQPLIEELLDLEPSKEYAVK